MENPDVAKIVEVLMKNEGALSDGYKHYAGSWGVQDQLEFVASKILDALLIKKDGTLIKLERG